LLAFLVDKAVSEAKKHHRGDKLQLKSGQALSKTMRLTYSRKLGLQANVKTIVTLTSSPPHVTERSRCLLAARVKPPRIRIEFRIEMNVRERIYYICP
jgi:hypothetical protein